MIRLVLPYIETSTIVHASAKTLWSILTDTDQWLIWGPSIRHVQCSDSKIKKGSKGRVQTALGFWLSFEVTDYVHERYWSWRVMGIRATGHRIDPLTENRCLLAFEVPVFAMPYVAICAIAVRRIARIAEKRSSGDSKRLNKRP
jgi:hypothetical protein